MSHTIPIEKTSAQLTGLVRALRPGDEIVLTDNNQPIARIVPSNGPTTTTPKRVAGECQGMLEIIDDSNDVILDHFKEYMP
jgi:antitoxin (DNA-binding transcriptional repressor) of toxin-antitoxin stability system